MSGVIGLSQIAGAGNFSMFYRSAQTWIQLRKQAGPFGMDVGQAARGRESRRSEKPGHRRVLRPDYEFPIPWDFEETTRVRRRQFQIWP